MKFDFDAAKALKGLRAQADSGVEDEAREAFTTFWASHSLGCEGALPTKGALQPDRFRNASRDATVNYQPAPLANNSTHWLPVSDAMLCGPKDFLSPIESSEVVLIGSIMQSQSGMQRTAGRDVRGPGDAAGNAVVHGHTTGQQLGVGNVDGLAFAVFQTVIMVVDGAVFEGFSGLVDIRQQDPTRRTVDGVTPVKFTAPVELSSEALGLLATALVPSANKRITHPNDRNWAHSLNRKDQPGFATQAWTSSNALRPAGVFRIGAAAWTLRAAEELFMWITRMVGPKKQQKLLRSVARLRHMYGPVASGPQVAGAAPGALPAVPGPLAPNVPVIVPQPLAVGELRPCAVMPYAAAPVAPLPLVPGAPTCVPFPGNAPRPAAGPQPGPMPAPGEELARPLQPPDNPSLVEMTNEVLRGAGFDARCTAVSALAGSPAVDSGAGPVGGVDPQLRIFWAPTAPGGGVAAVLPPANPVTIDVAALPVGAFSAGALATWNLIFEWGRGPDVIRHDRPSSVAGYLAPDATRFNAMRNYAGLIDVATVLHIPSLISMGVTELISGLYHARIRPDEMEFRSVMFENLIPFVDQMGSEAHLFNMAARFGLRFDKSMQERTLPGGHVVESCFASSTSGHVYPNFYGAPGSEPGPGLECQESPRISGLTQSAIKGISFDDSGKYSVEPLQGQIMVSGAVEGRMGFDALLRFVWYMGGAVARSVFLQFVPEEVPLQVNLSPGNLYVAPFGQTVNTRQAGGINYQSGYSFTSASAGFATGDSSNLSMNIT